MAGRTPSEAVRNYVEPLQKAVSCITNAVLQYSGNRSAAEPHLLTINKGNSIKLQGDRPISLTVIQHYRIIEADEPLGPWKVSIAAYYYTLEDGDGKEILGYHWHPKEDKITFPHLHFKAGAQVGRLDLTKAHFPTSRIALEDVLRLTIRDLGVQPQRRDWEKILDGTQGAYEQYRTWSGARQAPVTETPTASSKRQGKTNKKALDR